MPNGVIPIFSEASMKNLGIFLAVLVMIIIIASVMVWRPWFPAEKDVSFVEHE
jgi:hypothetical protein